MLGYLAGNPLFGAVVSRETIEREEVVQAENAYRPTISLVSGKNRRRIHQAALQILRQTGMQILHQEALDMLEAAGCEVGQNDIVRIPEELVEEAIRSAPQSIRIYDRDGNLSMDLGGYRSYFGTGSDLLYTIDMATQERRRCILDDVRLAAMVCEGLPNIDFIMSFAHPSEVEPHQAYLRSFQVMVESSQKPIVTTAEGRDDLNEMWEIAKILRNGEETLRSKPYVIHYAEPISPLKQAFPGIDKLLFCAEKGIPVIYSPAPIAGSTAPMTIAGHVTQGLAESLCGLVVHQLKNKGAPIIMGMGPAVLDMATGECSYNAPEYYLAYVAMVEMSHLYNLPSWGYAGTSDSQIPDGQATLEAGMITFLAAMAGANLNHDVGYLDFGRTGSLEMVVIMDELIDQLKRFLRGVPVNEEMLALDVVESVGPGGQFLTEEHTARHIRTTQWRPTLLNRDGYERWKRSGAPTLRDRARQKLARILKEHRPTPLSIDTVRRINNRVEQFQR
jgi:trimethylamine--corrinoid protein Co-methyltransferase